MALSTLIPALYTQEQISEMLQIPERTLEDWRYKGTGPVFVTLGRRVRYTEQAIADFIQKSQSVASK